jgi:hypothetical protein
MNGDCTCAEDFPGRYPAPAGATYHYVCERPIAPAQPGGAS